MTLTKQLAAALSALLTDGMDADTREASWRALAAYKDSTEFKHEQFEIKLRAALKTANELVDTVAELRGFTDLRDIEAAQLTDAHQRLAEGADYLNTLIEGEPT